MSAVSVSLAPITLYDHSRCLNKCFPSDYWVEDKPNFFWSLTVPWEKCKRYGTKSSLVSGIALILISLIPTRSSSFFKSFTFIGGCNSTAHGFHKINVNDAVCILPKILWKIFLSSCDQFDLQIWLKLVENLVFLSRKTARTLWTYKWSTI